MVHSPGKLYPLHEGITYIRAVVIDGKGKVREDSFDWRGVVRLQFQGEVHAAVPHLVYEYVAEIDGQWARGI